MDIPDNHFDGGLPTSSSPLRLEGVEVIAINNKPPQVVRQPPLGSLTDLPSGLFIYL